MGRGPHAVHRDARGRCPQHASVRVRARPPPPSNEPGARWVGDPAHRAPSADVVLRRRSHAAVSIRAVRARAAHCTANTGHPVVTPRVVSVGVRTHSTFCGMLRSAATSERSPSTPVRRSLPLRIAGAATLQLQRAPYAWQTAERALLSGKPIKSDSAKMCPWHPCGGVHACATRQ